MNVNKFLTSLSGHFWGLINQYKLMINDKYIGKKTKHKTKRPTCICTYSFFRMFC